jgi:hypothetical protein
MHEQAILRRRSQTADSVRLHTGRSSIGWDDSPLFFFFINLLPANISLYRFTSSPWLLLWRSTALQLLPTYPTWSMLLAQSHAIFHTIEPPHPALVRFFGLSQSTAVGVAAAAAA